MAWGIGEQTGAHPDPQSIPFLACRGHRASKKGVDARGWKLYHRPLGPSTQGSTSFLSLSPFSFLPLFLSLSLSIRCSFRCSILIRPTHQICASSSHEILSLKALAAPGASERLFDFRGARQVPAAIRGSCAVGRPRPSSASLDPHSSHPALSRSRGRTTTRPLPAPTPRHRPKCRSRVSRATGEGRGGYEKFRPQLRLRTREPPPHPPSFSSFLPYARPCDPATTPPSSHPYSANTVRPSSLDHRRSVYCCVSSLNRRMVSFVAQSSHRASTLEQRGYLLPRNTLPPCHRPELNNRARPI